MVILLIIEIFLKEEDGTTGIEYGLLAALIGAAVIGGQSALSATLKTMYEVSMGSITTLLGS